MNIQPDGYDILIPDDDMFKGSPKRKGGGSDGKPLKNTDDWRTLNGIRVCIDFDDTIAYNRFPHIGPVLQGAKESINSLWNQGYYIIISSCRTNKQLNTSQKQCMYLHREMEKFLIDNGIKFDRVDRGDIGKVYADIYVDDKGVAFRGDWKQTEHNIRNFQQWRRK